MPEYPALQLPAGAQLINGDWVPSRAKGELDVVDPATREPFTTVARAGRATSTTRSPPPAARSRRGPPPTPPTEVPCCAAGPS